MDAPQGLRTFEQAVPRRNAVSLGGCGLVLVAASAYLVFEGVRHLTTRLVGGPEILVVTGPLAVVLVLLAAGLVTADRIGRDAWLSIDDRSVTLHSRGVLTRDVVLPITSIHGVQSYARQYASAQLPQGAASVTPLSMGPWLALSIDPLVVPVRRGSWMWHWLFRAWDFSHVRTPSPRRTYSLILFGTTDADQAVEAIRDLLPA